MSFILIQLFFSNIFHFFFELVLLWQCFIANDAKLCFASVFNVSIKNDDQIELFEFSILSEDLLQ